MQGALLGERDFGVLLSVVTLLLGVVARNYEGYEGLVPKLVRLLERLRNKDVTPDYAYYGIPSPWLQVCFAVCICVRVGAAARLMHLHISDRSGRCKIQLKAAGSGVQHAVSREGAIAGPLNSSVGLAH